MESRIYLLNNISDTENTKKAILNKIKTLVSPDAVLEDNLINITKKTTWTKSQGSLIFTQKGKDLEVVATSSHTATETAIGAGCILLFFTLLLIVVPWLLYDQDKKEFDKGIENVLNYYSTQTER
jgi:hypothetical protein